jgi:hypothetical protein
MCDGPITKGTRKSNDRFLVLLAVGSVRDEFTRHAGRLSLRCSPEGDSYASRTATESTASRNDRLAPGAACTSTDGVRRDVRVRVHRLEVAGLGHRDTSRPRQDGRRRHHSLLGGNGNDAIDGGHGNDTINGGACRDSILGGDGNGTLLGGADADTSLGGDGDDTINGQGNTDLLAGNEGNDVNSDATSIINEAFTFSSALLSALEASLVRLSSLTRTCALPRWPIGSAWKG